MTRTLLAQTLRGILQRMRSCLSLHTAAAKERDTLRANLDDAGNQAIQLRAAADAKGIHVSESGGKVTLTGHATSWRVIKDVTNAAWSAPGVTAVSDELEIRGDS